jgi:hypothetical protein
MTAFCFIGKSLRDCASPLCEIALVSVYFDQFAGHIVNMDHGIMCATLMLGIVDSLTHF